MKEQSALLLGGIPFHIEREVTRRYLTADSFPTKYGRVPACWKHWRADSYVFQNAGTFFVTQAGLSWLHVLDLTQEREREVLALARRGELFLSHGKGATPDATRALVERWRRLSANAAPATPSAEPAKYERVEHMAYTEHAAYPQEPVTVLLTTRL